MEILDAVDLVGRVHREGDPVQALLADQAGEAGGVVRFACCSQNPVQDGAGALAALFQGVCVVGLAERLVVRPPVEGLSEKQGGTLGTGKALDVVETTHRAAQQESEKAKNVQICPNFDLAWGENVSQKVYFTSMNKCAELAKLKFG